MDAWERVYQAEKMAMQRPWGSDVFGMKKPSSVSGERRARKGVGESGGGWQGWVTAGPLVRVFGSRSESDGSLGEVCSKQRHGIWEVHLARRQNR